jgi:sugar phosphate isomerase/epimerase
VIGHPRLSVNSLSSLNQSLRQDIAMWHALGMDHVGLMSSKIAETGWGRAQELIAAAGLRVSTVAANQATVPEALEFAASAAAGSVYVQSGAAGPLTWEEAAEGFRETFAPLTALANRLGVALAVEPTNPLRADMSFVFSLRDAVDLARSTGIHVVLDLYSCWYERGLAELVRDNIDLVALVQVCDFVVGTLDTPNRAVPGDGDIPLERILEVVINSGYSGAFDLEILGPRIEAEGYPDAIRRSVKRVSEILDRLGA